MVHRAMTRLDSLLTLRQDALPLQVLTPELTQARRAQAILIRLSDPRQLSGINRYF
jgi:hypothetical protein